MKTSLLTKFMALRVLLADESSTIKKVMQLALQDFGVEVRAVPIGLDVLAVALSFKPEIIFVDVLLPKKSGYDVAKELKNNPQTEKIPLVLMWSGFMELDQGRTNEARADRKLEKPFDAPLLRKLVEELVPKTQTNPLNNFLTFPKLPDFEETQAVAAADASPDEPFEAVSLLTNFKMEAPQGMNDENWSHQSLTEIPDESHLDLTIPNFTPDLSSDEEKLPLPQVSASAEFEEFTFEDSKIFDPIKSKDLISATDQVLVETTIREEARPIIEKICWQIVPELAEKIIREEINKLLRETEK